MTFVRHDGRATNALRHTFLGLGFAKFAQGSCFVKYGDTHVLCTATVEERVPPFLKGKGSGWITAEYGMLPCSSGDRIDREAARGKQSGRTQEIQRLIGRALRAVVDLKALGERQVRVDCDVIQADGGTRTASITGAYVALYQALHRLQKNRKSFTWPIIDSVSGVSCGIVEKRALLDLNYHEDSTATVDANFVITGSGKIVEVQACAEQNPFEEHELHHMLGLAKEGVAHLKHLQLEALKILT